MQSLNRTIKYLKLSLFGILAFLLPTLGFAEQDLISLFPLDRYNQSIKAWIKPSDPSYDKPLLDEGMQQKRMDIYFDHYFGSSSPWSREYIQKILRQTSPQDVKTIEQSILIDFSNENKPESQMGYGENFRPYAKTWIDDIANNVNLAQFSGLTYQENHRGIAIDNLHARALPTDDVHFYHYKLAGQGFPFDNLQMSALWAGTPVYILGETRDHAWLLVATPEYIAWVKSSGIALASNSFIDTWTRAAKNKLAAITHTQTGLTDENGRFLFSAYVGSVFPVSQASEEMKLMVPVADSDHNAVIKTARVSAEEAVLMPLSFTPHHFTNVMSTLIGRPYGWGSMYFYNDCSAELKSVLTPFGIWLPRHSSNQVYEGKMVDMTAASQEKRLSYLMENGKPLLTLIYIGGHVVMYVGNYLNPKDQTPMAMTYQNIWGLSPNPATRRSVIGKSVLFPMLLQYPEDPTLSSLANKKYFQVSYLDELPSTAQLMKTNAIDLRALMYPNILFDLVTSSF